MVLKPFKHFNATSINEAVSMLARYKDKAELVAGGTDLLGVLKDGTHSTYPEALINIKTIPGLEYIEENEEGLKIGALTKLHDIETSKIIREKYCVLAEATNSVATPQIRNMATIGGNICQEPRCWYYRCFDNLFCCLRKGGGTCYALTGENQYHSIFGSVRIINASPCSQNCPNDTDIQSYLSRIKNGDLSGAAEILLNFNPLPSITGRVCPHFCEENCNRGEFDEPISVRSIERFLGDYILENAAKIIKPPEIDTGRSVAIVGSGPAGLSAAYYLRRLGYRVVVFERMKEPGGMLAYGIPPYRLPKVVVRRLIKTLKDMSIEFKLKVNVGKDLSLEELMESFDAVFLASGAWKEATMRIPGEELMKSGLEFLNDINMGVRKSPGRRVAVIGGGNVAIDVARVLLRLKAEPTVLYRRSEAEMPAIKEEVHKAMDEGVKFEFLTQPIGAKKKDGKILLKCVRMRLGAPDRTGRPKPIPIEGSEFTVEFDAVIKAIGQAPDTSYVPGEFLDERGRLKLDLSTCHLGKNLFAGGDLVTGPSTVVEAIAAGRRAAASLDRHLIGEERRLEREAEEPVRLEKVNVAYLKKISRVKTPELPISERVKSVDTEDVLSLSLREVEGEANRCFNCGCVADDPSDIASALIALNAKIRTTKRTIEAEKFFTVRLKRSTILDPDELVTEIQIPAPKPGSKQVFLKFRPRKTLDFPIARVASVIGMNAGKVNEARIVLGAVAPIPLRVKEAEDVLKGREISEETAEAAAAAAVKEATPLSKNKYKVQIIKALVKRAILIP